MTGWGQALLVWGQIIKEFIVGFQNLTKFIQENKDEQWFQDSVKIWSSLAQAKTLEERREIAKKMRDLIGGM